VFILSFNVSLLHKTVIGTARIAVFLTPYQKAVFSKLITGIIILHSHQLLCLSDLCRNSAAVYKESQLRYTCAARRTLRYWSSTHGRSNNGYKHFTAHNSPTSKGFKWAMK
jgi:hypothetical protein